MGLFGLIAVAIGILLLIFYLLYVRIIKRKNCAQEAWSDIDVQLKKRYDLIPNLVTIVKKYMEHEANVFEEVARLRSGLLNTSAKDSTLKKERVIQENQLTSSLQKLMITVENYPELKADQQMLALQDKYVEIEEHIAAARRFYNSAVNDLNNAAQIFPGNMMAAMINLQPMEYFSMDEKDRQAPSITMTKK